MRQQMGNDSGFGCCRIINIGIVLILILIIISDAIQMGNDLGKERKSKYQRTRSLGAPLGPNF